jgi:hypothetical protein
MPLFLGDFRGFPDFIVAFFCERDEDRRIEKSGDRDVVSVTAPYHTTPELDRHSMDVSSIGRMVMRAAINPSLPAVSHLARPPPRSLRGDRLPMRHGANYGIKRDGRC